MEIFKDEITKINYIDFEDILDENIETNDITKLLINGIINDYLHDLVRKFISFNNIISCLRSSYSFTHDEIVVYKHEFNKLYFELATEYNNAKEKLGFWNYIDQYTIEQLYLDSSPCKDLQLSDIFENKDFLKNIIKLREEVNI